MVVEYAAQTYAVGAERSIESNRLLFLGIGNEMQASGNQKDRPPKVSIGMPVYNGEAFFEEAIDSVLAQTFTDFEVVISDNGSDDRTQEICQRYAAQDPRVTYYRQAKNRGVSWNFDRVFELARGEYFQWVAYDDKLAPDYLRVCVAALDGSPDSILCQTLIRLIDEKSEVIDIYDGVISGERSSTLFSNIVLKPHWCTELLGVIRSSALRKVARYGQYRGADNVMLTELAMQGPFLRVDEPLFLNREHTGRFSASVTIDQHAEWFGTSKKKARFPLWQVYRNYFRAVRANQRDRTEKVRCYFILFFWWFVNWNSIRMVVDVLASYDPRIFYTVSRVKHRLFGSAAAVLRR